MDAVSYLRERMDAWLAAADRTEPIELACSRHELRGAARALREAGLLGAEGAHELLDEYDARLGEAGHLQRASASVSAATSLRARAGGPPSAPDHDPGRLQRVITVPPAYGTTPVGTGPVGLLLEVWTDVVAFHYRSGHEPSIQRRHGRLRWDATDDRGSVYTRLGSGAFSSRTGTLGVVEFAGRLPTEATRFVVRATGEDGETTSVVIDL